ncbi:MAG: nucleotidyl transferase AbiEii/AbiGii toxin family protein [Clostridia bacterium]|nr:nucleotidyl transferase AbiEii/AbiGii toxin family protein [Clostridia bacterium]
MNSVIANMLTKYDIKNKTDETNAMKEIIQEIVLCGLSRGGFFDVAAFYGGTALRIFYGLNRFSEDLDFALLKPDKEFDLSKYFSYIEKEVESYGLNLTITTKQKTKESNITSAFLKGDTKEHILKFFPNENMKNITSLKDIKIKFEVDVNPPSGAEYDFKYKLLPSPHQIRLYDASSLFAGKIHAVLCRGWNNRVKGRDLYDYIFYLSKNTSVNIELIKQKLIESKVVGVESTFNISILKDMLNEKFKQINFTEAKEDIVPFIEDVDSLNLWSAEFFIEITKDLK